MHRLIFSYACYHLLKSLDVNLALYINNNSRDAEEQSMQIIAKAAPLLTLLLDNGCVYPMNIRICTVSEATNSDVHCRQAQ